MAGEKYKEKKLKMRVEELQRRQEEENQIIQAGQSVYKPHAKEIGEKEIPVEERLLLYCEKYKARHQERVKENEKDEFSVLKNPTINAASEKMISSNANVLLLLLLYCDIVTIIIVT